MGEQKHGSRQGVLIQLLPAQGSQPIDAFAEIDRLGGYINLLLGPDLQHGLTPPEVLDQAWQPGPLAWQPFD